MKELTHGGKPHICGKLQVHSSKATDEISLCAKCNLVVDSDECKHKHWSPVCSTCGEIPTSRYVEEFKKKFPELAFNRYEDIKLAQKMSAKARQARQDKQFLEAYENPKPYPNKVEEIIEGFNDTFGITFNPPRIKQMLRNFLRTSLQSYGSYIEGEIRRKDNVNDVFAFEAGREDTLLEIKRKVEGMKKDVVGIEKVEELEERDRMYNLLNGNMVIGYMQALDDVLALLEKDNPTKH